MENLEVFPDTGTALTRQNSLIGTIWDGVAALNSNADFVNPLSTIRSTADRGSFSSRLEQLSTSNFQSDIPSLSQPIIRPITSNTSHKPEVASDLLTGIAEDAPLAGEVKIDFQLGDALVPGGYIEDTGKAYSETRGFGWVREDSLNDATAIPLDITTNARDRDRERVDQRLDTLVHMQYPDDILNPTAVKTPAAWEYDLPNGTYNVTVSVGDQSFRGEYDSQHTINIEGVNAIDRFQSTSTQEYQQATVEATVTDGKLTIDAIGGTNTKMNYVEIQPAQPPAQAFTIPVSEDVSVYAKPSNPSYNLNGNLVKGGLFSGVDGGLTASSARFYLKFNLPAYVPGTRVTSATLTGYYNDDYHQVDDDNHGIYFVASDLWSESTLTWENQPGQAYGVREATFDAAQATTGSFVSWDITGIVDREYRGLDRRYEGDGVLSLLFHASNESLASTNRNWEYFVEKEFDSQKAFRIELTTQPIS